MMVARGTSHVGVPAAGYMHEGYARSLGFVGDLVSLPASGGYLIARNVPGSSDRDGVGCYPVFCCRDWSALGKDIDEVGRELVTVTLVTDPFGNHDPDLLKAWFPDVCRPFKEHAIVDLAQEPREFVSSHHQRNTRRALKGLTVEVCDKPQEHLADWIRVYAGLVERHGIGGVAAFCPDAFAGQFEVPGLVMLRARKGNEVVGMILWYLQGDVGYYHLAAYTPEGYEQRASFALFWRSLEHFSGRVRWLGLGANAGRESAQDGLSRFKAGWATGTRTAYLCGRVCDRSRYQELVARTAGGCSPDLQGVGFFPAYRNNN